MPTLQCVTGAIPSVAGIAAVHARSEELVLIFLIKKANKSSMILTAVNCIISGGGGDVVLTSWSHSTLTTSFTDGYVSINARTSSRVSLVHAFTNGCPSILLFFSSTFGLDATGFSSRSSFRLATKHSTKYVNITCKNRTCSVLRCPSMASRAWVRVTLTMH